MSEGTEEDESLGIDQLQKYPIGSIKWWMRLFYESVAVPNAECTFWPVRQNEIRFGNLTVRLEHGDITESGADVLVNSTCRNLNLESGKLSSHLLKKAGGKLQDECNNLSPLLANGVVWSSGHDLKCKKILHCHCPQGNLKALIAIVKKCLYMTNENRFTSIALPALGTGGLGYPAEDVIAAMITAISNFHEATHETSSTIKTIAIVVYDKDTKTLEKFNEYFHGHHGIAEYQKLPCESEEPSLEEEVELPKPVIPTEWRKPFDKYQEVELKRGTNEWKSVEKDFLATLKRHAIVKKRSTSPTKSSTQRFPPERMLWHGTLDKNIPKITRSMFDRSRAGQNGTRYGIGCYFSTTSAYSDSYTNKPNQRRQSSRTLTCQPLRHIIRVKVLTGEFCKGDSNMKSAPYKNYEETEQYDSVVNDMKNPTIFVTFPDSSAYPEYVIQYNHLE